MAKLGPFDAARQVMAAVSGGADSMALAVLLAGWGRPVAAVVDHGLRPDSAAEAELTRERLLCLGIEARVLRAGLPPGPAAAERARAARYRLLLDACRQAGCADLVMAHHAGDQAETVRLRAEGGSAAAGLAGMAAVAFRAEARLLRPLLGMRPERLRATLEAHGVQHVEDPTNRDPRTGRGRLRATLTARQRSALLTQAVAQGHTRAASERARAAGLAASLIRPEGFAVVPDGIDEDALSALIWTISGSDYPPPRAALAAGCMPRTTHGVLIRPAGKLGSGMLLAREPDAVAAPTEAACGVVWDGRFRLVGDVPAGCRVGALGADAAGLRRRSSLPAVVLRGLPALRRSGDLVSVPSLGLRAGAEDFCFWPQIPVAGAPFVNLPAGIGAVD